MGGQLGVISSLGMGSTFYFEIDLEAILDSKPRRELRGKNTLLAIASLELGSALVETLQFHGVNTVLVHDNASAMQVMNEGRDFDFIVAEIDISGRDDLALAQFVNKLHDPKPALYLLGDPSVFAKTSESIRHGISGVLGKPFLTTKLLDSLLHLAKNRPKQKARKAGGVFTNRPPNILLVEANEVNAMVASHFLTNLGCVFKAVTDGQSAVEAAESEPFDIILMDVQLPILDGLRATQMIRASNGPNAQDVVIVALTANALSEEKDACFEAGMDDYLSNRVRKKAEFRGISRFLRISPFVFTL
jgi:CheY-like chemotaxis protein